jgi:hypothetical protein
MRVLKTPLNKDIIKKSDVLATALWVVASFLSLRKTKNE